MASQDSAPVPAPRSVCPTHGSGGDHPARVALGVAVANAAASGDRPSICPTAGTGSSSASCVDAPSAAAVTAVLGAAVVPAGASSSRTPIASRKRTASSAAAAILVDDDDGAPGPPPDLSTAEGRRTAAASAASRLARRPAVLLPADGEAMAARGAAIAESARTGGLYEPPEGLAMRRSATSMASLCSACIQVDATCTLHGEIERRTERMRSPWLSLDAGEGQRVRARYSAAMASVDVSTVADRKERICRRVRAADPLATVVDLGGGYGVGQWCLRLVAGATIYGDPGRMARYINTVVCAFMMRVPAAAWELAGVKKAEWFAKMTDDATLSGVADMFFLSALAAAFSVTILLVHDLDAKAPVSVGHGPLVVPMGILDRGEHYVAILSLEKLRTVETVGVVITTYADDPAVWRVGRGGARRGGGAESVLGASSFGGSTHLGSDATTARQSSRRSRGGRGGRRGRGGRGSAGA